MSQSREVLIAVDFLFLVNLYCKLLWGSPSFCVLPSFLTAPCEVPRQKKPVPTLLCLRLCVLRSRKSRVLSVALLTNSGNVGESYKINCFSVVWVSLLLNFLSLIVSKTSFVLVLKLPLDNCLFFSEHPTSS